VTKALPALGIGATLAQGIRRAAGYLRRGMSREGTFRAAAVVSALLGALLLFSSWDGLYNTLELPKPLPALAAQIGSLAVLGVAYLLWSAGSDPALARPAAIVGILLYLGSASLIASWLIFRDKEDLGIDDAGIVVLIIAAVAFAAISAALVRAARPT
jgi:hypothetical protein